MPESVTPLPLPSLPAPPPARPVERGPVRRRRPQLAVLADRDLASRSEAELIAQVLGGPEPAAELLRCGTALSRLPFWRRRALGVAGLIRDHGVAPERAVRLAALWELAERWYPDDRPSIGSPRDALLLLGELRSARTERIVAILLDARHRLLRQEVVALGSINASRLAPRDVLAPALAHGAAAVIMAHNHPSGDPTPSRADRHVTAVMREAAALLGMPLLDHIIVARDGHHSFRESEGWSDDTQAAS